MTERITIYLAGEIHSDWRAQVRGLLEDRDVPARCVGPQETTRGPTRWERRSLASSRALGTGT